MAAKGKKLTAAQRAVLEKHGALNPMQEAMLEHGVDPDLLARQLKSELFADETKFFAHQGEVVTREDVIAWGVRQKAREDAQKLWNFYPAEKHEHTLDGAPDSIVITMMRPAERQDREKESADNG
jgi:hypothetical protein